MKELLLLVKKNILLLIRSKTSALIVIFAPLLLILLIGLSYDNFAGYELNLGFVSETVSSDITSLQSSLESQDFTVSFYSKIDDCLFDIEQNYIHACLELPESFAISDNNAKTVTFHLDQSRMNIVWVIQEVLRNEFSLKTQEVSEQLVSNIFSQIAQAQSNLDSQRSTLAIVNDAQTGAVNSLGEVSLSVTDEDIIEQDNLISIYENFILDKIIESEQQLDTLQDKIDGSNITSDEVSEMSAIVVEIQDIIDDMELYTGGTSTYSFGQIEIAINSLQDSVSSAISGVGSANTNLASAQSDLSSAMNSLSSLSSQLSDFAVDDSGTISSPLVTNIELVSSEKSKFNYLFPSLLVLVVMFLSIMLGNTLVMMEKNSPAYIRNVLLPISKLKFILANYLSLLVMVIFQILILLLVSLLFVPAEILTFLIIFITLVFVTSVFGFIGMILGSLFSSEETSILASISTGSLFLFLSGVILPIEGMSTGLREITKLNPFVVAEEVIRRVFIFGANLEGLLEPLIILCLYSVILFLIILVFDSFIHQHLVEKILYKKHKISRIKKEKALAKKGKDQTKIKTQNAEKEKESKELGINYIKTNEDKKLDQNIENRTTGKHLHSKKKKKWKLFGKKKKEFEL